MLQAFPAIGVGIALGWLIRGYLDSVLSRMMMRLITGAIGPDKIRQSLRDAIDRNESACGTPAASPAGAPANLQTQTGDRP